VRGVWKREGVRERKARRERRRRGEERLSCFFVLLLVKLVNFFFSFHYFFFFSLGFFLSNVLFSPSFLSSVPPKPGAPSLARDAGASLVAVGRENESLRARGERAGA
jgi:hypothetical protein